MAKKKAVQAAASAMSTLRWKGISAKERSQIMKKVRAGGAQAKETK